MGACLSAPEEAPRQGAGAVSGPQHAANGLSQGAAAAVGASGGSLHAVSRGASLSSKEQAAEEADGNLSCWTRLGPQELVAVQTTLKKVRCLGKQDRTGPMSPVC